MMGDVSETPKKGVRETLENIIDSTKDNSYLTGRETANMNAIEKMIPILSKVANKIYSYSKLEETDKWMIYKNGKEFVEFNSPRLDVIQLVVEAYESGHTLGVRETVGDMLNVLKNN